MQRDSWPLTGRSELVDTVLGHLNDPACDGVFLVGQPGVGLTRLATEVYYHFQGQQRRVSWVVGSQANHGTRFGALSHALPGDLGSSTAPLDPLEVYQRIRDAIGSQVTPQQRVIGCVDDIRWLDDASLGLMTQLLAGRLMLLVATVRDDAALPDALDTIERSCSIRRVVVPPLTKEETIDLVYAVMDGAVEGTTIHRLADAAQGNPLYLAETIEGSITTGALTKVVGTWMLHGAPTVTARLARLFDSRLERLDAAGRDLLDLLALAEPVTLDALEAAGLLQAAIGLEEAGFLSVTSEAPVTVRIAQPLVAAQVNARTSPLRRRALLPRAIDLVSANGTATADDTDKVRLALWRLECGRPVTVAELEEAAALARAENDFESTAELATAAVEIEPSFNTLLLQAEALFDLCRFEQADEVMRRVEGLASDDLSLLRLAVVRHRALLWGQHDGDGSVRVLQQAIDAMGTPILRDFGRVAIANAVVFSGHPAMVAELQASMEVGEEAGRAALSFSLSVAAALQGRVDDAVALGRDGIVRRAEFPDNAPMGHPVLMSLALAVALVEQGGFTEADAVLAAAYASAVEQRLPQLQIWLALTRGRSMLFRGDITEAGLWFMEARLVADRTRFGQGLRIAFTGLAVTAAQQGDLDTARLADAALREMPADHGLHWPERHLAHAWVAAADGRTADAVAELRTGAAEAEGRGEALLQVELLYEAARLGSAAAVAAEFAVAAKGCQGPLIHARGLFVKGAAKGDPVALAAAEKQFANLGAWVSAAEAASELGRVLHRAGRPRDAQGAAHRAGQYVGDLDPALTPMLTGAPVTVDLSPRELEIALLAADGHASKVIAQRLGLSVRTVSNHLQNAYLKLGISGRDDLADALADLH